MCPNVATARSGSGTKGRTAGRSVRGSIRRIVGDGRSHSSGREVGNQLGAVTGVGGRATDERGFPEVGLEPALFVEVTHVDQRRDGLAVPLDHDVVAAVDVLHQLGQPARDRLGDGLAMRMAISRVHAEPCSRGKHAEFCATRQAQQTAVEAPRAGRGPPVIL